MVHVSTENLFVAPVSQLLLTVCFRLFLPLAPRYFRSGAPPVINPLRTHFPADTAVPGVFSLTLSWTLPNRTSGIFNVSSPLPGDWFLAAHLPQAHGHISVKVG